MVTGAAAGQLLRVAYTGATVTSATLTLQDGRVLSMTVAGGELIILLPIDTPNAPATITATLADSSVQTLVLGLQSALTGGRRLVTDLRPRPPVPVRRSSPSRIRLVADPVSVVRRDGPELEALLLELI